MAPKLLRRTDQRGSRPAKWVNTQGVTDRRDEMKHDLRTLGAAMGLLTALRGIRTFSPLTTNSRTLSAAKRGTDPRLKASPFTAHRRDKTLRRRKEDSNPRSVSGGDAVRDGPSPRRCCSESIPLSTGTSGSNPLSSSGESISEARAYDARGCADRLTRPGSWRWSWPGVHPTGCSTAMRPSGSGLPAV
jgi:hypothetical protein